MKRLLAKNITAVAVAMGLTYFLHWGTSDSPYHWVTWLFAGCVLIGTIFWILRGENREKTEKAKKTSPRE